MARTSKTRIGGDSGEQSDRMIRAGAQGQQMVARAHEGLMTEKARGRAETQQRSEQLGQIGAGIDARSQQQSQFDAQMTQRERQFGREMEDREARTDLEGAKAGFERGGNDRAAKLEQEMARGAEQTKGVGAIGEQEQKNLQEQGKKPLELDSGTWRPSEQGKEIHRRKNFEADTERIRAETYRDQVGVSIQKAKMQGDKEQAQKLQTTLSAPINKMGETYDRFMNGKATEGDWRNLSKMAKGIEGFDPEIEQAIKSREWSPRLQAMLRTNQSHEALKYVVRTGDTSDLKNVDWTSPQMQQFTERVGYFNALAKSLGPAFSQFAGINSIGDKMSFLNMQAAISILSGMDTQEDPTQGMTPSAGLPPQGAGGGGGDPMDPNSVAAQNATGTSDPYATDEMTQSAIQARQRGEQVPPADSPEFQQRFGGRQRERTNLMGK